MEPDNKLLIPKLEDLTNSEESKQSDISKFEWGSRKSAFLPYKHVSTVLTNLQRGNTETKNIDEEIKFDFHTRAAQGEITLDQIKTEGCDIKDKNGLSPLHWASFYGQTSTVNMLIDCGADVNKLGPEHETPLLLAACGGYHETIKLLLDKGADVNHTDIMGNTALMYAAARNHPHSSHNLLLRGADFTMENDLGENAYSLSIHRKSTLAQAVIENYMLSILQS